MNPANKVRLAIVSFRTMFWRTILSVGDLLITRGVDGHLDRAGACSGGGMMESRLGSFLHRRR
jgi:hypothetical protein